MTSFMNGPILYDDTHTELIISCVMRIKLFRFVSKQEIQNQSDFDLVQNLKAKLKVLEIFWITKIILLVFFGMWTFETFCTFLELRAMWATKCDSISAKTTLPENKAVWTVKNPLNQWFFEQIGLFVPNISEIPVNPISAVVYILKMTGKNQENNFLWIRCGNLCKFCILLF